MRKPQVLPGILSQTTCRLATRYAEILLHIGATRPDGIVPGAPTKYGDPLMDAILEEVRPAVQDAVGEELAPTYSYFRIYAANDKLDRHTDRTECEVSVSVCLYRDGPEWPLMVEVDGKAHPFAGGPGTGTLYFGPEMPHWREPYTGRRQIQLFLHFVRKAGPNIHLANDSRDRLGVSVRDLRGTSRGLSDHIMVIDDALPGEFIDRLLGHYEGADAWLPGLVGPEARVELSIRDVVHVPISDPKVIGNNPVRKALDAEMFRYAGAIARAYGDRFPRLRIDNDSGYEIMKYPHGGFYMEHVDDFPEESRTLGMSVCLNDDFDGGELSFFGGNFSVSPRRGRAVVFPANFMFPHQVMRVENGTRYVVVTWFR